MLEASAIVNYSDIFADPPLLFVDRKFNSYNLSLKIIHQAIRYSAPLLEFIHCQQFANTKIYFVSIQITSSIK